MCLLSRTSVNILMPALATNTLWEWYVLRSGSATANSNGPRFGYKDLACSGKPARWIKLGGLKVWLIISPIMKYKTYIYIYIYIQCIFVYIHRNLIKSIWIFIHTIYVYMFTSYSYTYILVRIFCCMFLIICMYIYIYI